MYPMQNKTAYLRVRVEPADRKTYVRAAKARGMDFSTWVRYVLTKAIAPKPKREKKPNAAPHSQPVQGKSAL